MKKSIEKILSWLAVWALLINSNPSNYSTLARMAIMSVAVHQASSVSLFAPDLPKPSEKAQIYQVASSTFTLSEIAFSSSSFISSPSAFPAFHAESIRAAETFVLRETPRKILIPESSIPGNAAFVLTFDNPAADVITQAKIFDITGAEVADFTETTPSGSNPMRVSWDGRDQNGSIVHSGIYIYQVQAGGSLINGTVVVAR